MSRLLLKFESATLKEVPLGTRPVTIGRAPDNDIQIDNLAVSNYHARVYVEAGSLVVEDLNSLNGSFLNEIGFATSDVTQMLKYLTARGVIATPSRKCWRAWRKGGWRH